ncbi:hypothetical protein BC939DRAFT_476882 [Gamsiella multidivaricata]|uniref:uncharacterized protein n=1 Tax=Gamsiella multidivaricata TaxID=101098 RepID=UPI00221F8664|nr:uncharacterized protein BC939DRAFT_476882 [Gamsiella multidivaricata]KAG0365244.1 hypothetical protein BGZ54_006735 [Gamsiella multidivaricata]KAI7824085.1 hypothetical protein BC939DRAFT_476882 [Gamsiella multidivaricata]
MSSPEISGALLVPEILTAVGQHLSRMDFLQAVLVSRSWHAQLIPLLWHTLALPRRWRIIMATANDSPSSGYPDSTVFKKYAHLVRSLACNNIEYHLHYLVPFCNQLTELDIADLTEKSLPLLQLNTATLTSIRFERERERFERPFGVKQFLQVMNKCPFLDRLRLVNFQIQNEDEDKDQVRGLGNQWSQRDQRQGYSLPKITMPAIAHTETAEVSRTNAIALFYQLVYQLSTLELVRSTLDMLPLQTSVFYRLQKLSLLEISMAYKDQLVLVSRCQYLTHLKLRLTRESERLDLEHLASVELEVSCPNITHLDLSWSTLKDQEIAAMLEYLPHLISFHAQRTNIGETTVAMLTNPTSRIKDQLQELDLVDAREMQSAWIQRLLCSCSGLRRFRATKMNARDIVHAAVSATVESNNHSSTTLSIPVSGWGCLQLQELQLSIIGLPTTRSQSSYSRLPSSPYVCQQQLVIYEQLSRLTQLQVLSLGGNCMSTWFRIGTLDLSLRSGFGQLRTLKELQVFNFSYMAHDLGMNEVEFMMEHWKKLRRVVGTVGVGLDEDRDRRTDSGVEGEAGVHGRWLKPKVERHEIYIHRKWPLVQFSST